ncbi:MAG: tautomerase family protein [Candidatus Methylomirabilis oxyfera]|nr:tautomerase family protein [Candidatus Methylomirabilis oxyfera]
MPLVRISLREGKPEAYRRAIADGIHRAMVETINVPPLDRFQVITEHPAESLIHDPAYLEITRSDDVVFVQITLNAGRSTEQKRALYARMAELLGVSPGLRPQDLLISLVEVPRENWSFGNGEAQYAS